MQVAQQWPRFCSNGMHKAETQSASLEAFNRAAL